MLCAPTGSFRGSPGTAMQYTTMQPFCFEKAEALGERRGWPRLVAACMAERVSLLLQRVGRRTRASARKALIALSRRFVQDQGTAASRSRDTERLRAGVCAGLRPNRAKLPQG